MSKFCVSIFRTVLVNYYVYFETGLVNTFFNVLFYCIGSIGRVGLWVKTDRGKGEGTCGVGLGRDLERCL